MSTPSIGSVVHFVYGETHCAALITDPGADAEQSLVVFPPNEAPFTTVAAHSEGAEGATWHWPEYVP